MEEPSHKPLRCPQCSEDPQLVRQVGIAYVECAKCNKRIELVIPSNSGKDDKEIINDLIDKWNKLITLGR